MSGVLALAASACMPRRAEIGTLRIGVTQWHAGVDPYQAPFAEVAELAWICGDGLIGVRRGVLVPRLASEVPSLTNGGVAPDGRRIVYRLRHDVRWHDGRPLRSVDVKLAFQRLMSANAIWRRTPPYNNIDDIAILDERSFQLHLRMADRNCVPLFFSAYGALPIPLLRHHDGLLIGTSSYRMTRRSPASFVFERAHFEGKRVHLHIIDYGNSESAAIALHAGDVDAVVPIDRTVARDWHFRTLRRRSGTVFVLANVNGRLASPESRSTILNAIDSAMIARRIYFTEPTEDLLPAVNVRPVPFRSKPYINPLRLCFPRTPVLERVAVVMASGLARQGITLELRGWPLESYATALRSEHFDLALYGGQFAVSDDAADFFSCAMRPPIGDNYSQLCDANLDRAFRTGNVQVVAEELQHQCVLRVLAPYEDIAAFSTRIELPPPPESFTPWFADIYRW